MRTRRVTPLQWCLMNIMAGLDIKHLVYMPIGHVVLKMYVPCKNFHANICTSPVKLMYTAGKISMCPDWKMTSRARNHKSLCALEQDLHATGVSINRQPHRVQPFDLAHIEETSKRHWPSWGESTVDRWISLTKAKWRVKYFHLMRSSCLMCREISPDLIGHFEKYDLGPVLLTWINLNPDLNIIFCIEESWEHVSVHWQHGNHQLWANCFTCWNPVSIAGLRVSRQPLHPLVYRVSLPLAMIKSVG